MRTAPLERLPSSILLHLLARLPFLILLPVLLPVLGTPIAAPAWGQSEAVDFQNDIRPLFVKRCYRCHSELNQESELRLDDASAFLAGGRSGHSLSGPADGIEQPFLLQVLRGTALNWPRMPPIGEPLSEADIDLIERWIEQGAVWPDSPSNQKHWAYLAPIWPVIPESKPELWRTSEHPIDGFVGNRLLEEGLSPTVRADPARLLRRVALDLTGLPPTPDEVDAFVNDPSEAAYKRVVESLLAKDAYGERWASHWLDLARYADSNGYEKDGARQIWPWRDWVISAFNQDMPYDQFTIEQLAGDLLPGATHSQEVATGFLRNSMLNEEGGIDPVEFHYEAIIDRLATTSTVFLGSTIQCARCHDHKYDPFSQREFYALLAVFNSQAGDHRSVNSYTHLNGGPVLYVPSDEQKHGLQNLGTAIDQLQASNRLPGAEGASARKLARQQLWRNFLAAPTGIATTMVMKELDEPRPTHLHQGGNYRNLGEAVSPGIPQVFPGLPDGVALDRLSLARWIASSENPLTSRVAVNRIWEQLFGVGLVKTTEDFGTQGEAPSHPELLDWLARRFQFDGYSIKSLLRLIVTSETYRQSSSASQELYRDDPDNRLLARGPRFRLGAEAIRDQSLYAAGLLVDRVGGPSVFPSQPEGIWNMPYNSSRWRESEGQDRYRRGVYTWWQRSATYPAFTNFDAPSRETSCTRRTRTNTPLQALTTLNDPAFFEAAQALALRVLTSGEAQDDEDRLQLAFQLLLARSPTPNEHQRLAGLLEQQRQSFGDHAADAETVAGPRSLSEQNGLEAADLAAWTMVANVLLNLDETLTKP